MKNTTSRKRLYLVSFGDSDTYRYVYTDSNKEDTIWNHPHPLEDAEKELREHLSKRFPQDTALAYYYTPRLVEVSLVNENRYASYPEFDAKALQTIKSVLEKEISKDLELQGLNNNAPNADATL